MKQLEGFDQSIMNQAGHPCRPSLQIYKETDLLNHYIVPVQHATTNVCEISLQQIVSKVFIVTVLGNYYCILQPNSIEYH